MNTGQYNDLIDVDRYQFPNMKFATLASLQHPFQTGMPWNGTGVLVLGDQGLDIDLQGTHLTQQMELSLDGNDNYLVSFMDHKKTLASLLIPASMSTESGLALYTRSVPDSALQGACDHIRILPVRTNGSISLNLIRGDDQYSIGHLIFK